MRLRLLFLAGIFPTAAAGGFACGGNVVGQLGGTVSSSSSGGHAGAATTGTGGTGGAAATGAGSTGTTTGTGGAPSACSGGALASPPPSTPPTPPNAPDGTGTTVFAVSKLYLGDTDPDGTPDPTNGWTHFGYDLDGLPPDSTKRCMPFDGAMPVAASACGVQNAFGQYVTPLFEAIFGNLDDHVNLTLAAGKLTVLLALGNVGPGASQNPVMATIAEGGDLGSAPHFDGSDLWPVIAGTQASFPQGYVTGDTWVSGPGQPITVPLPVPGYVLSLQINHPIVTMRLDATHQKVTGGILAGVVPTDALISQLVQMVEAQNIEFCTGGAMTTAFDQIEEASDILQDGTQDPSKTCDGITIGLGFDALPVQLGPEVPAPLLPTPCAVDAGADGG